MDHLRHFRNQYALGRGVWGQLALGLEVRLLLYWFSLTFAGRPDATGSYGEVEEWGGSGLSWGGFSNVPNNLQMDRTCIRYSVYLMSVCASDANQSDTNHRKTQTAQAGPRRRIWHGGAHRVCVCCVRRPGMGEERREEPDRCEKTVRHRE